MRPWTAELAGRLEHRELVSETLADNALGDPPTRPISIYLPPGYDEGADRYPAIFLLQGFGAAVTSWQWVSPAAPTVPERLDRLFASGEVPPCLVVYVDAWTSLGGSQFVDSPATGRYHTYLCEEVVDFVDQTYRTLPEPAHRALQGKSSGGYGAIVNTLWRPDRFGAFAAHAPDAYFELWLPGELGRAYRALRDHYGHSYAAFRASVAERGELNAPDDHLLTLVYAMAACYASDEDGRVHLPFDERTGALDHDVLGRIYRFDPLRLFPEHREVLASLRGIWIDAGRSDEYLFDVAANRLVAELDHLGISDVEFQLFPGGHRHTDDRYPLAAAYLARRIAP